MRLLLDTHIALWALTDSSRLPAAARSLILNAKNEAFYSAATVWEIAIKHALAREQMPVSGAEAAEYLQNAGYVELPITSVHAAATEDLPPHHADPFDRMLVAQSITEPLRLITHDRKLMEYGDTVLYV